MVKNTVQGTGIGTKLVNWVCEYIKSRGGPTVILHILEHPAKKLAIMFYHKTGFKDIAHDLYFWGPELNRVIFVKDLD